MAKEFNLITNSKKFNYFSSHLTILRIFGLWYSDNETNNNSKSNMNYFVYLICRIIFLFTFAYLFTILEIIQLFLSYNNFDDFINNLCYAIVHVMACSKITLVLVKSNDLKIITSSFGYGIFKPKYEEGEKILIKCYKRTVKLLKIYFIIGTSVVTNGLLCPLYFSPSNINALKNSTTLDDHLFRQQRKLPYVSYFPFDVKVSPNYEIAYVYQGICLMTLSPLIVTIDVLYGSILLHIAAQLRMLGISLINIKKSSTSSSKSSNNFKLSNNNYSDIKKSFHISLDDQSLTKYNLNYCIDHHQAIIRITEEMENIFSPLVLLQFLCNLVIMCFPLFQITTVPVMSFPFFSMVSLMAAMMYQLFIFCNCGDEVNQQSLLVANYAYFIDWYNNSPQSDNLRGAVITIIHRSQKPLRLTVAKFALLSRETYLKVVQGSVSYFMFLRKVRDK